MNCDKFTLIESRQYGICRARLHTRFHHDLDETLRELETNPTPPLTKPLRGDLSGKHTVRFANQSHRLIIKINWSTCTIILVYLAPRNDETYYNVMWS